MTEKLTRWDADDLESDDLENGQPKTRTDLLTEKERLQGLYEIEKDKAKRAEIRSQISNLADAELAAKLADAEAQAKNEYQAILTEERDTTGRYWRLGDTLTVLRTEHRKDWLPYTKKQGWEYNKVQRALRVRKRYKTQVQAAKLTLMEALAYGKAKANKTPVPATMMWSDAEKEAARVFVAAVGTERARKLLAWFLRQAA